MRHEKPLKAMIKLKRDKLGEYVSFTGHHKRWVERGIEREKNRKDSEGAKVGSRHDWIARHYVVVQYARPESSCLLVRPR